MWICGCKQIHNNKITSSFLHGRQPNHLHGRYPHYLGSRSSALGPHFQANGHVTAKHADGTRDVFENLLIGTFVQNVRGDRQGINLTKINKCGISDYPSLFAEWNGCLTNSPPCLALFWTDTGYVANPRMGHTGFALLLQSVDQLRVSTVPMYKLPLHSVAASKLHAPSSSPRGKHAAWDLWGHGIHDSGSVGVGLEGWRRIRVLCTSLSTTPTQPYRKHYVLYPSAARCI